MNTHPIAPRFRLLTLILAAALGGSALAYAQSDSGDTSNDQPKQDQDYSLVVHRVESTNNGDTNGAHKILNNSDVFYRIHVFNASSAPANATINYTIFDKTNIDRSGNSQEKVTNVTGTENFIMPPHSNKVIDTKAASGRELKYHGTDNTVTGQVMGIYVEMIVDGKKVDSHESPPGIRAQMRKNEKQDDQPGLGGGQA
ncbi:MAG: hypothetical protein ABSH19_01775 [Opitutales bacterium]|jgi:hypothetical protein